LGRTKTLALLTLAGLLAGCSRQHVLVVGSKNFTEQLILGEIIAQHVEDRLRIKVDRRLNLGGTLLAHQALISGGIDLYPEYTGTALTAVLKLPPSSDPDAVFETVRKEYRSRFRVEWLPPLGFNNSFVMVVRGDDARACHLETVSQAAVCRPWQLGEGYEFQTRPDGYPALVKAYPLRWAGPPRTMDLGLLYQALEQNQVSMIAANGTDGMLAKLDVTVLRDDKSVFPPYQAAIAVRSEALARFRGLRETLEELSGKISEQTMRRLNYEVDGEHKPVADVAAGFLRAAEF
jgi:osmoprotectant transport system substrate-binding protein